MVTKNELVAIIAALNTDFNSPTSSSSISSSSPELDKDTKAHNDATYFELAEIRDKRIASGRASK